MLICNLLSFSTFLIFYKFGYLGGNCGHRLVGLSSLFGALTHGFVHCCVFQCHIFSLWISAVLSFRVKRLIDRLIDSHRGRCVCIMSNRLLAVRAGAVCGMADSRRDVLYLVDNAHVHDLVGSLRSSASTADSASSSRVGRRCLDARRLHLDAVLRHRQSAHRCLRTQTRGPTQRPAPVFH